MSVQQPAAGYARKLANLRRDVGAEMKMTKRTRNGTILLVVALLYLATALVGGTMVRRARPYQAPFVVPILPFVLVGHDTTGLVGEDTLYVWYGVGVKRIWKNLRWIA